MNPITKDVSKLISEEVLADRRKSFGDQIRQRRQHLGLSQDKLSYISGIRKATLIDAELGRNVEANTIFALLEILKGSIQVEWSE